MRCWIDKDEFWPYFHVWTADAPRYAKEADVPVKVLRRYEEAAAAFEAAHSDLEAALKSAGNRRSDTAQTKEENA